MAGATYLPLGRGQDGVKAARPEDQTPGKRLAEPKSNAEERAGGSKMRKEHGGGEKKMKRVSGEEDG
jgi:hypothetical protein